MQLVLNSLVVLWPLRDRNEGFQLRGSKPIGSQTSRSPNFRRCRPVGSRVFAEAKRTIGDRREMGREAGMKLNC